MALLEDIDPQIAETVTIGALDDNLDILPPAWRVLTGEKNLPDSVFLEPIYDAGPVRKYVEEGYALMDRAPELLQQIGDTNANRLGVIMAQGSVMGDITQHYNRILGRTKAPMVGILGFVTGKLKPTMKEAQIQGKDKAFLRKIQAAHMNNFDRNMEGAYQALNGLTKVDGSPSQGWTSSKEKEIFMKSLKALREGAKKSDLQKLWVDNGGEPEHFEVVLWPMWVQAVLRWEEKFEALEAPNTAQPLGEASAMQFLRDWGIQNSAHDLLEIAEGQLQQIEQEIARLRERFGETLEPPLSLQTNQDVLNMANARAESYKARFIESGVLPNTGTALPLSQDTFQLKSGGELKRSAFMTTYSEASGRIEIYPIETADGEGLKRWTRVGNDAPVLVDHELTHHWQNQCADEGRRRWMGPFGMEGAAVASERVGEALNTEHEPVDVYGQLLRDRAEVLRFIVPMKFHAGIEPDRATLVQYLESFGIVSAESWLSAIETDPSSLAMYWPSLQLFIAYADQVHEGDYVQAFSTWAEQTHLTVAPHFLIPGDASNFKIQASTPLAVRMSQEYIQ